MFDFPLEGSMLKRAMNSMTIPVMVVLCAFSLAASAYGQQCLIVRSAEGHRFRNAMVAGVLTGGVGMALGGAFSGGRYEYVDGVNFSSPKMKYKGGELQKLQEQGVHIIVINKKAAADETTSARESCKDFVQQSRAAAPAQAAVPAQTVPPQVPPASQGTTAAPPAQSLNAPTPSEPQQQSLGDAARRYRDQKAGQPGTPQQQ
jgi:hypothetical protein